MYVKKNVRCDKNLSQLNFQNNSSSTVYTKYKVLLSILYAKIEQAKYF